MAQEDTVVVNEDLLKVVTFVAKSCRAIAQLSIGKDIDIVRRVTSPPTIRHVTASLNESPTTSKHPVEGPTSFEVLRGVCLVLILLLWFPGLLGCNQFTLLLTHYFFLPRAQRSKHHRSCNTGDRV